MWLGSAAASAYRRAQLLHCHSVRMVVAVGVAGSWCEKSEEELALCARCVLDEPVEGVV